MTDTRRPEPLRSGVAVDRAVDGASVGVVDGDPSQHVVLAHGFTQTARSWDVLVPLLAERLPTASFSAVDLPGHGTATRLRRDLWRSADHLARTGGPGTFVGYSMGGRVALHAALRFPGVVRRLVLIGATAGIMDRAEREARRLADQALADSIMRRSLPNFLDDWLSLPLFAGLTEETDQRADRLRNTRAGLASSLRLCGTGTQEPLWDRLGEIGCPTLVLAGEDDPKFTELGRRLADSIPSAELVVVAGSGHSVHLEAPVATADTIGAFLSR